MLQNVEFSCKTYSELVVSGAVVYCDPPYAGTTAYSVEFDSDDFWQWCRNMSENNLVFISEYSAPEGFSEVWRKQTKLDIRSKGGVKSERCEKLFVFNKYTENFQH